MKTAITSLSLAALVAAATGAATMATPAPVPTNSGSFEGAVYAMSNDFDSNTIVAYGRDGDGMLTLIGEFPTGGRGANFDGGEGLDPLISAYALITARNNRFVLAVNAGSNTVSALRVNPDYSLTPTSRVAVAGVGPNSIAVHGNLVYVSSIDADGVFTGEPDQEGALTGFRLNPQGRLIPVSQSTVLLGNRPSAIQFSPNGEHLVVASINAGSSALSSGSVDEMVAFKVRPNGRLRGPSGRGASTFPNNAQGRNLPSAIGFEIVEDGGREIVVVTEAREFRPDGSPPAFDDLQTGSISTWELTSSGALLPLQLDVLAGSDFNDGQRTACWIEFARGQNYFWVSNALESTLSTFSFVGGQIALEEEVEAAGTPPAPRDPFGTTDGWIDLWISADGRYLYQLFGLDGTIGVFEINGASLNLIQEVSDLPEVNTQGIVAF